MAPVIFEKFVLKEPGLFIPLFIEIALDIAKPFCQILSRICDGPIDLDVKMGQGISVLLL